MKKIVSKSYLQLLLVALCGLFTTACDTESQEPTPLQLFVHELAIDANGGQQFIRVEASEKWRIRIRESWCTVDVDNAMQSQSGILLTCEANPTDSVRTATIRIATDHENQEVTLTQAAGSGNTGGNGGGTGGNGGGTEVVTSGYLELASVPNNNSNYQFLTHYTTINNRSVRNYSMLFDKDAKIALWVAYPHCAGYMGSQKRTDAWSDDPKIDDRYEIHSSMGSAGYSRGHQIPSSDRTANSSCNKQTFYYSNQTPQKQDFNGLIWLKLENEVKDWARGCDTLYVVTGAALNKVGENKTVKRITDKAGQRNIAVPNYYYKVLLRRKSNKYDAIGFWFDHKDYGNVSPSRSQVYTVDQIEAWTGFDFFHTLPQAEQEKIESSVNHSSWGY